MFYINTIREWHDILMIFFPEPAWKNYWFLYFIQNWKSLTAASMTEFKRRWLRCYSDIAKWCSFLEHFHSPRRKKKCDKVWAYKSQSMLVTTKIVCVCLFVCVRVRVCVRVSVCVCLWPCTSDVATHRPTKYDSKMYEWF